MRLVSLIVIALGLISIAIAMLLFGLSALGHLGILADVGPTENRAMSMQFFSLAFPALAVGAVVLGLGLLLLVWSRRR